MEALISWKSLIGTRNLNKVLQQLINPPSEEKTELVRGDSILRVDDRVMQLKNDYNKEVFNGDLGLVMDPYLSLHTFRLVY